MSRASMNEPGPIQRRSSRLAPVFRRSTWAFAFKRSFRGGRSVWGVLFFAVLVFLAGILLAVANYRHPFGGIMLALISAPLSWYWLCARPGDRRDPVGLLARRHERVTGTLVTLGLLALAAWCAYRSWQLAFDHHGLKERVVIGVIAGVLAVSAVMLPLLFHARLSVQVIASVPAVLVLLPAVTIAFPRWSAPVAAEQAWAFPVLGAVVLACGLFVGEMVRRGTFHLAPSPNVTR